MIVFENSFNRPNIYYYIKPKKNYFHQLLQYLNSHKDESGVIYCLSRNSTERLADDLKKEGKEVDFVSSGNSLKFCLVAEGKADVYPRFAPTMEWDTAAGQAVIEIAAPSDLIGRVE